MKKILSLLLILFMFSASVIGCTPKEVATDYSQSNHWLSLPSKITKDVDVFYLYPTAWNKVKESDPNICEIDNKSMLKGSKFAFQIQATAFKPVGNIYAPYYRQVDAAYSLSLPLEEQSKILHGAPKEDVFAAFDYYIKHYNEGRPFILVGHSQGSNMLVYLLEDYMKEHPQIYDRMIASYVVGYSVTGDYMKKNPHLKFAEAATDTGVIVSYNTEAPGITGKNPVLLDGALAINPITWTRDESLATREQSLGSTLPVGDKIGKVEHFADARVDLNRGVVVCSTADKNKFVPTSSIFEKGMYHSYDYLFYYYDLRQNAADRAAAYLEQQK